MKTEPEDIYDQCMIGVTSDLERVVYDYDKIIDVLASQYEKDGQSRQEAIDNAEEYTEFNTVRALLYMGEKAPVIVRLINEDG